MNKIMKCLFVLLAIVLLVQVIPAMADGPDHRPEEWEIRATAEAAKRAIRHPERSAAPRATATAIIQPYPIETPVPYPMPEKSGSFFEWLRGLLWKVE